MTSIRDVMTLDAVWAPPETTLLQASRMMRDKGIGFLPVGENGRLIGVVTDRDIAVRGMAACYHPQSDTVGSVMTPWVYYCFDDQSVEEVCQNMAKQRISRMPVVNRDKKLVGVVSIGDLARKAKAENLAKAYMRIKAPDDGTARKAA